AVYAPRLLTNCIHWIGGSTDPGETHRRKRRTGTPRRPQHSVAALLHMMRTGFDDESFDTTTCKAVCRRGCMHHTGPLSSPLEKTERMFVKRPRKATRGSPRSFPKILSLFPLRPLCPLR